MAQRIQRKRTKGWRMPEGAVIVDRSTKWGNPFIVNPHVRAGSGGKHAINVPTVEDAVNCFRDMIEFDTAFAAEIQRELRGKDLACWCKPGDPCHADVLLEIANR